MITKDEEDTILIKNILDGNQVAQKTLYEKYSKVVRDYIKCKYSVYFDIDDDVQDILIKVFLTLDTFDTTKSKFKSWVTTISKNHMIDKWRDKTIKLTSFTSACISTTQMDNNWIESNLTSSDVANFNTGTYNDSLNTGSIFTTCNTNTGNYENCNSVTFLSSQISPSDFTLLDMKYVQGYNYTEIGKEFNLTSATISNKVNYIKTKLKKNYSELIDD